MASFHIRDAISIPNLSYNLEIRVNEDTNMELRGGLELLNVMLVFLLDLIKEYVFWIKLFFVTRCCCYQSESRFLYVKLIINVIQVGECWEHMDLTLIIIFFN